jgi:hypothetical protein
MTVLQQVERHLRHSGERPCQLGRRAAKDPCLVRDLRNGRQPGPTLSARILAYIEQATALRAD